MSIIQLNSNFIRKIIPARVFLKVAADDVLQGTGDEEILLDEAKLFTAFSLIIRVELMLLLCNQSSSSLTVDSDDAF